MDVFDNNTISNQQETYGRVRSNENTNLNRSLGVETAYSLFATGSERSLGPLAKSRRVHERVHLLTLILRMKKEPRGETGDAARFVPIRY